MIINITYFIAFVALGLVGASLGPTLPSLAAQTASSLNQISFLFAGRSFGYLVGSFLGGRLYDRWPGHPLMGAALILIALTMMLVPTIPALWLMILLLWVLGIGEGALDVGGNTLLVWVHGERVGPFMNGMHFFFGVGSFLAPVLVAQVILASGSIAWAYWLIGLVVLPVGFWLLWLESPSKPGASADALTVPRLNVQLVTLIVIFFVLYVGAEISYAGWVFSYAVKSGMATEATAAYITSGFWVAFTLARLLSIPVSGKIKPRYMLALDFGGALLSLAIMLIWTDEVWALWVGSLGFGFSIASIFPTMITFAGQRMPVTGKITGYFFLGATIGAMVLPWLIGQFFETIGPQFMMWSLAVDMVLAVVVLGAIAMTKKA